jgi:hypothetical protein
MTAITVEDSTGREANHPLLSVQLDLVSARCRHNSLRWIRLLPLYS